MPTSASRRPTVERKILFYRANVGMQPSGRPIPYRHSSVLEHVRELPFTANGRYLDIGDGQAVCCWPTSRRSSDRLRFGHIRRSGLPQVDRGGKLGALSIPANAGLAEQVHVRFFRHNIVGCDFNFYGPRLSRLAQYFSERADGIGPTVEFEPLLRQDVIEQLNRLEDVRLFAFKVRSSFIDRIAQAERSLGDALQAAATLSGAHEVELVLRARPRTDRSLLQRVLEGARRVARIPELRVEASRFLVRGLDPESEEVELIDVLRDHFISSKRIVLQGERSRALDTNSAFEAIAEAHRELRPQLEAAAAATT